MSVTLGKLYRPKKIRDPTVHDQGRGGGARGILDVESDVFFWFDNLHARYFLGQKICHVFYEVLKDMRIFVGQSSSEFFFSIHSNLFSATCDYGSGKKMLTLKEDNTMGVHLILFTSPFFCHLSCTPGAVHQRGSL